MLDRKLDLHIFPRDRIMCVTSKNLDFFYSKELFFDYKSFSFDMFYYISTFNYKNSLFYCFQATKITADGEKSYIIICDKNLHTILTICASDFNLDRFYSPQVILTQNVLTLYFTADTNKHFGLYSLDISNFQVSRKQMLLKTDLGRDQFIFYTSTKKIVLFSDKNSHSLRAYQTQDFKKYYDMHLNFNFRESYLFINNPSLIKKGRYYYLFCRASTKNALESKIISFKSSNLKIFYQTDFELGPTIDKYERHSTAFPYVAKIGKQYTLYYTGYWGKHLMEKRTLKNWTN